MGFNEYLKGELEYRGMPVKELAHKTGIPKQTIDKYLLSNGSMPPADKAVAIAHVLGVSVEYLVTGRKIHEKKISDKFLSPEMRSIANSVEPLTREKRKIVESAVIELIGILRRSEKDEQPAAFTPLQKVFLRLFR
ncbi:MAG: helix-turn-helix domain-containing protein [Treponema sp.]|jgi:transcriptional regulator with XRE-family HTH domain|nr:helix-turn-helix domain-containing protein [Treponema sp.]